MANRTDAEFKSLERELAAAREALELTAYESGGALHIPPEPLVELLRCRLCKSVAPDFGAHVTHLASCILAAPPATKVDRLDVALDAAARVPPHEPDSPTAQTPARPVRMTDGEHWWCGALGPQHRHASELAARGCQLRPSASPVANYTHALDPRRVRDLLSAQAASTASSAQPATNGEAEPASHAARCDCGACDGVPHSMAREDDEPAAPGKAEATVAPPKGCARCGYAYGCHYPGSKRVGICHEFIQQETPTAAPPGATTLDAAEALVQDMRQWATDEAQGWEDKTHVEDHDTLIDLLRTAQRDQSRMVPCRCNCHDGIGVRHPSCTDCNDALDAEAEAMEDAYATKLAAIEKERDAASTELAQIDAVLGNRSALDGKNSRADKILHAINAAKEADPLRAEVERLKFACQIQVATLKARAEKAAAELAESKEVARSWLLSAQGLKAACRDAGVAVIECPGGTGYAVTNKRALDAEADGERLHVLRQDQSDHIANLERRIAELGHHDLSAVRRKIQALKIGAAAFGDHAPAPRSTLVARIDDILSLLDSDAPPVPPPTTEATPIPMRLPCPTCGELHIDVGDFATKVHHTHSCQHCGMTWRPAVVPTVGVQFLPGFKNVDNEAVKKKSAAGEAR